MKHGTKLRASFFWDLCSCNTAQCTVQGAWPVGGATLPVSLHTCRRHVSKNDKQHLLHTLWRKRKKKTMTPEEEQADKAKAGSRQSCRPRRAAASQGCHHQQSNHASLCRRRRRKKFAHLPQVALTAAAATASSSSCFLFYILPGKILLLKCKIEYGRDVQHA